MLRPRLLTILALASLLALLAACGGSDKDSESSPPSAPSTAAAPATQAARPRPANPEVIVSTTTSTVDAGLLEMLQPIFEKETGYRLTTLSQGSGAALATGARGEADVILAHSPDAELQFIKDGHGTRRELVMHNDFVVVGPAKDPAGIKSARDINDAMQRIARAGAAFISRGDNSGTHALEQRLWKNVNLTPSGNAWYQESGSGMGQTLQIASEKAAYTITDRGTYLSLTKNLSLDILREGDAALLNVYHVIQVNPSKSAKVNAEGAANFIQFLISPATQKLIGEYGKDRYGQPLFVPDYGKDESRLGS